MKRYTSDHDWVVFDNGIATVGITRHAEELLGELVYIELPAVGSEFAAGDVAAIVESVKAASEIRSPCGGEVVECNCALSEAPEGVNRDPEGEGWIYKMTVSDVAELDGLMDQQAYMELLEK